MSTADRWALAELSAAYAFAVDETNGPAFSAVFTVGGRLEVYRPGGADGPSSLWVGHAELARVPAGLAARYPATRHVLGQSRHEVHGDRATGRVYCTAHHLQRRARGAWDVMRFVRYDDVYERTPTGWLIAERVARVEWVQVARVQLGIDKQDAVRREEAHR